MFSIGDQAKPGVEPENYDSLTKNESSSNIISTISVSNNGINNS